MSGSYVVTVEGLESFEELKDLDEKTRINEARAVNKTIDRIRAAASRDIRENINVTRSALASRLSLRKVARPGDPEAILNASDRPRSLASFVTSRRAKNKGVTVEVKPGERKEMLRAFIINLANGNRGLAIRLKPGETLKNKKYAKELGKNLYILYGPSVNQMFRMIAEDRVDEFASFLENEFIRLQERN